MVESLSTKAARLRSRLIPRLPGSCLRTPFSIYDMKLISLIDYGHTRMQYEDDEKDGQVETGTIMLSERDNAVGELDDLKVDHHAVDEGFDYAVATMGMEIDPAAAKRVLRKTDLYILPLMCALMSCQICNKSSNSYASIMGLQTDLDMSGQEYSWVGSSFYLGYLFFELPACFLLQRFPLAKVVACAVVIWGVVVCCHGACQSSATFLFCRTLLGVFESFMDPAYMLLTSQWYRRDEQYLRSACWLGLQGFGTMIGSGIAAGLYRHQENGGSYVMAAWRLLYVITGVITIFFGLISLFHVPDIPVKAWFLNDQERKIVVERVRGNKTGFVNHHFKISQFKEGILDPIVWLAIFFMIGYGIPNSGIGNFGSILLHDDFGFSTYNSLLMNMVGSGMDIVFPFAFALFNVYVLPSRLLTCFIINSLNFMSLCMLAWGPNMGTQLTGWIISFLTTASWACMSSVISSNIAGYTKKSLADAVFLASFSIGNIVGPQAFNANESPQYPTAKKVMVGTYVPSLLAPLAMLAIFHYRNKKKDQENKTNEMINSEFADMTDIENPEFRYAL